MSLSNLLLLAAGLLAGTSVARDLTPGAFKSYAKISKTEGGFSAPLQVNDQLGRSVTLLGDLDGDGIPDVASGAMRDDDGGMDQGAVYILFLNRDGSVKSQQKISALQGNFTGDLDPGDQFGRACGAIGDVDGDGIVDLAVGANFDDDGAEDAGAIWVLFLKRDGTVRGHQKISALAGNFSGKLDPLDEFGRCFAPLGDFDGDGVPDLAAGAPYDDDGAWNSGAIWLLYLNADGTVKSHGKISQTQGEFQHEIGERDYFGWSLATVDLDLDGTLELITGEVLDDDGDMNSGAVWVLFLEPTGRVRRAQKISQLHGNFTGELDTPDQFGVSVCVIGDVSGDGIPDLAVGAVKWSDGAQETGSIFVLYMNRDGTVNGHHRFGRTGGAVPLPLSSWDWIGSSLAPLGDLDLDGVPDLVSGARNDDDGGSNLGALYVLYLEGVVAPPHAELAVGETRGEVPFTVGFSDRSTGTVTSWEWDFGDGGTSSQQHPEHTYTLAGTYTVRLSVSGPGGSDLATRRDLVTARSPVDGSTSPYGCGVNPPGSLVVLSGEPRIGTRLTFGVDNPLGTQSPGSIARLGISLAPAPGFPCGISRPRLGMAGGGAPGELLIDLSRIDSIATGEAWSAAGSPAAVPVDIAPDPTLIGLPVYVQGILVDPQPTGTGPRIGLGSALAIVVGS